MISTDTYRWEKEEEEEKNENWETFLLLLLWRKKSEWKCLSGKRIQRIQGSEETSGNKQERKLQKIRKVSRYENESMI